MSKCAECKWKYPDSLLSPMMINGAYTKPICAICALELSNKAHGVDRTLFTGEIAEHMRQLAIRWRKKNPTKAPTVN